MTIREKKKTCCRKVDAITANFHLLSRKLVLDARITSEWWFYSFCVNARTFYFSSISCRSWAWTSRAYFKYSLFSCPHSLIHSLNHSFVFCVFLLSFNYFCGNIKSLEPTEYKTHRGLPLCRKQWVVSLMILVEWKACYFLCENINSHSTGSTLFANSLLIIRLGFSNLKL